MNYDWIKLELKLGTVIIESRIVPNKNGGIDYQGRSIHKDENGRVEKTTPWQTNAVLS